MLAVQRVLTEYGYGQIRPTGVIGPDTAGRDQEIRAQPQDAGDRRDVRSVGAGVRRHERTPAGLIADLARPHLC